MGSYGAVFSSYNQKFFGYISYIYIFALIYPLYIFYKNQKTTTQKYEIVISFLLFLFSLLILQAIVIDTQMRGVAGSYIVDFLAPFIGIFGVLVLWLVITLVSFVITIDEKNFMSRFVSIFKNSNQKPIEDFLPAKKPQKAPIKQALKKEEPKEEPKTEDEPKSEDEPQDEPKNILSLASKLKEQKNAIVVDELEENAKLLEDLEKGEVEKPKNFKLPPLDFLQKPTQKSNTINEDELDAKIKFLLEKLSHFKIDGDVVRTYAGPVVSTFEFKPAANVKVSRILNLQDDLAMALSAETIRIQAPIPGKDVVGIEIPNETIDTIYLRELVDSKIFKEASSPLTIALGKDIVGKPFVTDLKKLPHLLIAGTTGSGKSVGINAMILSLLYKNSPDQLRLLMIDPKMLEFSIYNDIPHLLTPVITKAKQAIAALNNMVGEMERRYALMSETKTKNIESYNEKVKKEGGEHFPYIVIIIDELADLMMTSGKDVEHSIARLAQMARASGIHLVVATQRPSVDVVTGLIKANLPSRISYRVGQKVDSKIILDQMGAESLLGRGDMLFTPPGSTGLVRLHAPWSSEDEIEKIVEFIKSQREPNYDKSFLLEEEEGSRGLSDALDELDPMYEEAKEVIYSDRKTSISYLQRKLQIGYNKAARLIEQLEARGVLSEPNSKGVRDIL
jgi:S-DNA-T family DNA segregation ATPase FtsK/SpoIIIE